MARGFKVCAGCGQWLKPSPTHPVYTVVLDSKHTSYPKSKKVFVCEKKCTEHIEYRGYWTVDTSSFTLYTKQYVYKPRKKRALGLFSGDSCLKSYTSLIEDSKKFDLVKCDFQTAKTIYALICEHLKIAAPKLEYVQSVGKRCRGRYFINRADVEIYTGPVSGDNLDTVLHELGHHIQYAYFKDVRVRGRSHNDVFAKSFKLVVDLYKEYCA